MNKEEFPNVSKVFIESLEELVPKKMPTLLDKDREIWYNVGVQSLITLLRDIHEMQNDNILSA